MHVRALAPGTRAPGWSILVRFDLLLGAIYLLIVGGGACSIDAALAHRGIPIQLPQKGI